MAMSRPSQMSRSTSSRIDQGKTLSTVIKYWSDQRIRFLIIGAWNTAFGYGMFVAVYALLCGHIHYLAIAILAHFCAASVAFTVHKRLVFRTLHNWLPEFLRYNISLFVGLAASLGSLFLLVSVLGAHPIIAQTMVTVLVVVLNYILHSRFSFAHRKVSQ